MQPILQVNLTTKRSERIQIPAAWEQDFLGGASLAARLLYEHLSIELNALSPEAPLLFLNGPLSGTAGPAVGRFVVCGKSPATGIWAESNCGGFWGPELRFAGYDGLWITGIADQPVYLWINEGVLEFRAANHIWGEDTYDAQVIIKGEIGYGNARVAVVGPAAENGVLYAGIFCDHGRTAGRTGLGTVMAAKNLKGVAVYGKKKPLPLVHPNTYNQIRSDSNRALKQDNEAQVLHALGTASAANYSEYMGAMPSKYYKQGNFEQVDDVSGSRMAETILSGTSACHACVIACGRVVTLKDGNKRKGPEYETIVAFGPNLLNDDLAAVVHMGELCDRYGMDTISMGNTLGLAFQLYEKGLLKSSDTGGLHLKWGDVQVIEQLIHMTASREGIGDQLAQGSRSFGRHYGVEEQAVQVNGLEVPYHDPRGVSGMALVYATSPRGACHNQSDYFFVDWGHTNEQLGIEYYPRQANGEKAANVARHQDWRTAMNAMVMCIFANVSPSIQVDLINNACGYEWDVQAMVRAGERGWNLKRAINNRLGITRTNDKLPKALLEPYVGGGSAGHRIDLDEMLTAYYAARGWNEVSGRPSRTKLQELGLGEIVKDIWPQPEA